MRVRVWCLLFVLLAFAGGLVCEPEPTPAPVPTTTPAPTRTHTPIPTNTPTPTPHPPVTLRWNLEQEPYSIDPAFSGWEVGASGVDVTRQLFVGLTAYDPRTSEPVPDLATHWDVSDTGQVYTFHLRADVQWVRYDSQTDQVEPLRPVTAHDVVYSLRRAVDPETLCYTDPLFTIRNAEAIHTMPVTGTYDMETLGVMALDDYTVQFTLERPAVYLPAILAMPVAWPVPCEAVEAHGDRWTKPQHIVTNGPYVLTEWEPEKRLRLRRNSLYHSVSDVQIERVEYVTVDEETALSMYESGALDTTWLFDPEIRNRARAYEKEQHVQPLPYAFYYVFDTTHPPFDDVHARRAFSFAIDRQTIVGDLERHRLPANSFFPPAMPGHSSTSASLFDPQRAREELALAGYPGGRDFPDILCLVGQPFAFGITRDEYRISQMFREMWKQHLGVVNVSTTEIRHGLFYQPPTIPQLHLWRSGSPIMDYLDPACIVEGPEIQVLDHRLEEFKVRLDPTDPAVQRLRRVLAEAAVEFDQDRRQALYREADRLLCIDICAIVPVFYYTQIWLTKPYLHRDYLAMGGQNFKDWRIDPH